METVKRRRAAVRAAFPATVPVMTGFLTLSIAYGILMRTNGYGPLWSTLMSAIGFGGSMRYVAITLPDYLYWVGGTALYMLLVRAVFV